MTSWAALFPDDPPRVGDVAVFDIDTAPIVEPAGDPARGEGRIVELLEDGRVRVEFQLRVEHHGTAWTGTFLAEPSAIACIYREAPTT